MSPGHSHGAKSLLTEWSMTVHSTRDRVRTGVPNGQVVSGVLFAYSVHGLSPVVPAAAGLASEPIASAHYRRGRRHQQTRRR